MKSRVFLVEGSHEARVIEDVRAGKVAQLVIKPEYEDVEIVVIHANQIKSEFLDNRDLYDEIIFVFDNDVDVVNRMVKDVEKLASRLEIDFITLEQTPFLETFLCSFFADFNNNENWTKDQCKAASLSFLGRKFGLDVNNGRGKQKIKRVTISKVIRKGGDVSNILPNASLFGIMELFEIKNV